MRLICLIQARDSSTRLPKKATMDLNGKTMIGHVYDRITAVGGLDAVVVSTTEDSPEVMGWCKVNEVPYHTGPDYDLLDRHLGAAKKYNATSILRITADCPFHDPAILDKMVGAFKKARFADGISNWANQERSVSEGLDAAIITTWTMERLSIDRNCPREDWISYLFLHPTKYRCMGFRWPQRIGHEWHLSVDTPEDMERARKMMAILGNNEYGYVKTLEAYCEVMNESGSGRGESGDEGVDGGQQV